MEYNEEVKKRLEHIKKERAEHINRVGYVVVYTNELQRSDN